MTQLLGMLPGMAQSGMLDQGQDKATQLRMKSFMTMMDSMTDKVGILKFRSPPPARVLNQEKNPFFSPPPIFSSKTKKNPKHQELDSTNPKTLHEPSRIWRVAQGSGCHPDQVAELVGEYMRMRATIVGSKGQGGLMKAMGKSAGARGGPNPQQMAQMQQHVSIFFFGALTSFRQSKITNFYYNCTKTYLSFN